jgi:hypothetical protein
MCAVVSENLGEPLAGTAPRAQAWIGIEDPGPWSAKAIRESRVGWIRELDARAQDTGVGLLFIRRPGRPERQARTGRRVLIASTRPGRVAAELVTLTDPDRLADLDLDRLSAGALPGWGRPRTSPQLLVCTNGRRDACCAVAGRALASQLALKHPSQVWECTHLGGHRFAPTALSLPSGYAYGRLTRDAALSILRGGIDDAPLLSHARGRTTWDELGQAAELAALAANPQAGDVVEVLTVDVDRREVVWRDGSRCSVQLQVQRAIEPRAISCTGDLTSPPSISLSAPPSAAIRPEGVSC